MAQGSSGWNSFFHQNNAYDTSYTGSVAGTTPNDSLASPSRINSSQRISYFQLREDADDYDATNNIPLSVHTKQVHDVERGGGYPNTASYPNKQDSFPYSSASNTQANGDPIPSAPLASDVSLYGESVQEYGDAALRRHTSFGEPENRSYSVGNGTQLEEDRALAQQLHQRETDRISRLGENQSYFAAHPGDTREKGHGVTPLIAPDVPKAAMDPKVIKQLQKKKRWRPWFTWLATIVQIIMLIVGYVKNKEYTGSFIETKPFNLMLGPAPETLILMGARFVPCMRPVPSVNNLTISCHSATGQCTMEEICGFGGFHGKDPNQWYRFIIPIFLHGGLVHILFNLLFQLQVGAQVEADMGFHRYGVIYMASGIFGFIFGGNFSSPTLPSLGASGSLFGIIGILLLDLLQNWKLVMNPCWELTKLLFMIIISFLIGLLPFLDNFSHIGGFFMGVITGLVLMPTIDFSKFHKRANWILRLTALPLAIVLFVFLITNFYAGDPSKKCPWCKYLSCLPINDWCEGIQNTTFTNGTGTS